MRDILQSPNFTNQKSKAGFDMSQRRLFTCQPGQLLPCYKDYLNPGDKVKIQSHEFIRTEAIESAAFVEMTAHVDWFFVPFIQLFQFFNEFFNSTQDIHTSYFEDYQRLETYVNLPYTTVIDDFRELADFYNPNTYKKLPAAYLENGDGTFVAVDAFGQSKIHNYIRLSDMLEYGVSQAGTVTDPPRQYPILDYLAYHRIFFSHYNDSRFFQQSPRTYNTDIYANSEIPNDVASEILTTMRYRPYTKDFFTNISPSPQYDASYQSGMFDEKGYNISPFAKIYSSALRSQGSQYVDDTVQTNNIYAQNGSFTSELIKGQPTNFSPILASSSTPDANLNQISAQDIRTLFAFDRILQITQYSGSSYEEQTKAHFGYSVPKGISREAYYLGSFNTPLQINEVVATATTAINNNNGSVVGDIAGKGFGTSNNGKPIEFESPCHGILMAIHSISVKPMYQSSAVNKLNLLKDTADFYHPEFDDLGLQPVALESLFGYTRNLGFAWQYRYSELKDKYDIVHQSLAETFRSIWQVNKQDALLNFRQDDSIFQGNQYSNFFICPQVANTIFAVQVPTYHANSIDLADTADIKEHVTPNVIYQGDNFLCNVFHSVHKLSIMSLYSLPKLY